MKYTHKTPRQRKLWNAEYCSRLTYWLTVNWLSYTRSLIPFNRHVVITWKPVNHRLCAVDCYHLMRSSFFLSSSTSCFSASSFSSSHSVAEQFMNDIVKQTVSHSFHFIHWLSLSVSQSVGHVVRRRKKEKKIFLQIEHILQLNELHTHHTRIFQSHLEYIQHVLKLWPYCTLTSKPRVYPNFMRQDAE